MAILLSSPNHLAKLLWRGCGVMLPPDGIWWIIRNCWFTQTGQRCSLPGRQQTKCMSGFPGTPPHGDDGMFILVQTCAIELHGIAQVRIVIVCKRLVQQGAKAVAPAKHPYTAVIRQLLQFTVANHLDASRLIGLPGMRQGCIR